MANTIMNTSIAVTKIIIAIIMPEIHALSKNDATT